MEFIRGGNGGDLIMSAGKGYRSPEVEPGFDGSIIFKTADGTELMRFDPNGIATVRGIVVEDNQSIFDAFCRWLLSSRVIGTRTDVQETGPKMADSKYRFEPKKMSEIVQEPTRVSKDEYGLTLDGHYEIAWHRIDSMAKCLVWVNHLSEKNWVDNRMIMDVIAACVGKFKFKMPWGC